MKKIEKLLSQMYKYVFLVMTNCIVLLFF